MLSPALIDLVKYYEGLRLVPYRDGNGYWTNGYGHLLSLDKTLARPPRMTQEEAEGFLATDLAATSKLVYGALERRLGAYQLSALVDYTFNFGIGRLRASTLLRKINRDEDEDSILYEFTKWVQPGSVNQKGLMRRRGADIQMWLTGGFDPVLAMDYYRVYKP